MFRLRWWGRQWWWQKQTGGWNAAFRDAVVWTFLALPYFGIGMKIDLFQSCDHSWVFQICWPMDCSTLTASSFRVWNSSAGIPSPPVSLFTNKECFLRPTWPHILKCEIKWALESITTNKASGGDRIPVQLFQILKDNAVNVLHWICQQLWKTHQWPQE